MKKFRYAIKAASFITVLFIFMLISGCGDKEALSSEIIKTGDKETIVEKYTEYDDFDKSLIKVESGNYNKQEYTSSNSESSSKSENNNSSLVEKPEESSVSSVSSDESSETTGSEAGNPNDNENNWKSNNGKFY